MTTKRPTVEPDAWDDGRLATAFVDRYDRPAPGELTPTILGRVRETRRRPRWWPEFGRSALAWSTALVVLALVGVFVLPGALRTLTGAGPATGDRRFTPPAATSRPVETPHESLEPSPAVAGFPATVVGLQVRSVAGALALFERPDLGDTEVAVAGWYSELSAALRCRANLAPPLLRAPCGGSWLSASDRPVASVVGTEIRITLPDPAIEPRFLPPVDPPIMQRLPAGAPTTKPLAVVLVGHIHDEAASSCPADYAAACEQTFVVDLVLTSAGVLLDQPSSFLGDVASARLAPAEALQAARDRVAGVGTVLSIGLFSTANPPWLPASLDGPRRLTWFVRGYRTLLDDGTDPRAPGTPVAGWLAIDDATGAITGTLAQGVPAPATPFPFAPPPDGFPTTIEGFPVRTVADVAEPARPPDEAGAPLAVAGWLFHQPVASCMTLPCVQRLDVLAGTDSLASAVGTVIYPVILPGSGRLPTPTDDLAPRRVILVGHQGDRRARPALGSSGAPGAADFVLDQVAWVDGTAQGPSLWVDPTVRPVRTADQVLRETYGGNLLAAGTWPLSIGAIRARDLPSIGVRPSDQSSGDSSGDSIVWAIRVVGNDPVPLSGGLPGWGWALVDDVGGASEFVWTSP